jgi:hypothetical protein
VHGCLVVIVRLDDLRLFSRGCCDAMVIDAWRARALKDKVAFC